MEVEIVNYQESITWLEKATSFGIKPGLKRIESLLFHLGNPENKYKVIHITGTNGKGSTAAFLTSVLETSGIRVGRYTSPHLLTYTERIYALGRNSNKKEFAEIATIVKKASDIVSVEIGEFPTEFELLTAMAFLYFAKKQVEYVVLEVGMGGRYDSTNVVLPLVSIITNVAREHTKYLGDTITEIAWNKAGVIKENIPCVTAADGLALHEIRKEAGKKKSPLYIYEEAFFIKNRKPYPGGQEVSFEVMEKLWQDMKISLVGSHQAINAGIALMSLSILQKQEFRITEDSIRKGYMQVFWPGRFEMHMIDGIPFVMDGAHNAAGAKTLKEALEEQFDDYRRVFVFTSLQDKDTTAVISYLMRPQDKVFIVEAPTPRTRSTHDMALMVPCAYQEEISVEQALNDAVMEAADKDVIVVCGSLYMLGEAVSWYKRKNK